MSIYYFGLGSVFFAIGLILALSKSAKGATVLSVVLGLVGGGGSVWVLGDKTQASTFNYEFIGGMLSGIGLGLTLGLLSGIAIRFIGKSKNVETGIQAANPDVQPEDKIVSGKRY